MSIVANSSLAVWSILCHRKMLTHSFIDAVGWRHQMVFHSSPPFETGQFSSSNDWSLEPQQRNRVCCASHNTSKFIDRSNVSQIRGLIKWSLLLSTTHQECWKENNRASASVAAIHSAFSYFSSSPSVCIVCIQFIVKATGAKFSCRQRTASLKGCPMSRTQLVASSAIGSFATDRLLETDVCHRRLERKRFQVMTEQFITRKLGHEQKISLSIDTDLAC
jgi:hypothetical protein